MINSCKIVALFFILFASQAFAMEGLTCRIDIPLDLNKMRAELKSLSLSENQILPKYKLKMDDADHYELSREPVPEEIQDLFYRIQDRVFGKQLLRLESSTMINFAAALNRHSILVNPMLWDKIKNDKTIRDPKNLLRFIMSHELGHYIQHMVALKNKQDYTINGLFLFRENAFDRIKAQIKARLIEAGIKVNNDLLLANATLAYNESHIEVDSYGYLIFEMIGGNTMWPSDLEQSFKLMEELYSPEVKKEQAELKKDPTFKIVNSCVTESRRSNLEGFLVRNYLKENMNPYLKEKKNPQDF